MQTGKTEEFRSANAGMNAKSIHQSGNLAIEKCKKNVVRPVSVLIIYLLFLYIKTLDRDQFTRDYQITKISILKF